MENPKKIIVFMLVFLFIGLGFVNAHDIIDENGTYEIINQATPTEPLADSAMNPDKLTIGINANPAGLLLFGPSVSVDFSKGNFNSEVSIIVPFGLAGSSAGGVGFLATLNYLWHSRIGAFYLGGGIGYIWEKDYHYYLGDGSGNPYWDSHMNTFGLNVGYRFVTASGMYYRIGAFAAVAIDWASREHSSNPRPVSFYIKPALTIGYSF